MDIPRTIGYTEIVKIAECALNGDSERARVFLKRYIGKYPDKDLVYPFTHLLNGVTNPSGLNSNIIPACDGKADSTSKKDLRVCEVIASASDPLERKSLIDLGFKEMPHFTVAHSLMYPLGRHRHLSAGCVGTPNEMLWICETDDQNDKSITEIICLHNYDYDGYLTIKKVIAIINSILCKSHF